MNFSSRLFCAVLFAITVIPVQAADHVYGTVSPWGQMVDPDGDCSFTVSRDAIMIGFSGAMQGLDAEQGRMNAPRILRSMEGDFAVDVTVDGNLSLPDDESARAYVSGGLVLLQDDRNYIRFERASFTRAGVVNHYANFEQRIDAKRTRMGLFKDFPLPNEQPVDLRLEVSAGTVRALVRLTDQSWHEMGTAKLDGESTYSVGVSGVNTSGKPVNVAFRGIKHQQPLVAIEAKSSSNLNLSAPAKVVALPNITTSGFNKFMGEIMKLQQRSKDVDSMDAQARQQWIDDAKKIVREGDGPAAMRFSPLLVAGLSRSFQEAGDHDLAISVFDQFIEVFNNMEGDDAARVARQLKTTRDQIKAKLEMIGKPLEIEGETLSGDAFDWQSYKGKVVLVDFWASWCGPCRREIPNVLEQYRNFHDQGFEVVGICLDTDRDKAEKYIADEKIPWLSLFAKDAGWKHPMATKYGVTAIPTAILVDRDGKVVSLSARGEKLGELLTDLIGPVAQ